MTAVANKKEGGVGVNIAPLYIGMAVVVCAAAVPGSVFNPARAFGPALLSGVLANHWVLWVGPIFGAITASLVSFLPISFYFDGGNLYICIASN